MKVLLIEPYYTGSHKKWAEGFKKYSSHHVKILSMKGQFWKWRMHGGAVTLAKMFNNMDWKPDLILSTDMLDLTTFLALTRVKSNGIPTAIYFHENQISYPWSPRDRDILNYNAENARDAAYNEAIQRRADADLARWRGKVAKKASYYAAGNSLLDLGTKVMAA